MYLFCNKWFWF